MVVLSMDPAKREHVLQLMKDKDKIEAEINQCGMILHNNNIDMTESLVDNDGYPRNDIDVYQVRQARHRIICLQNDLKKIMKDIENGLHEVHSTLINGSIDTSVTSNAQNSSKEIVLEKTLKTKPFVKVNLVSPNSPAERAGLLVDDLITEFGSVHFDNFTSLHQIGQVVSNSVGRNVLVVVLRNNEPVKVNLVPNEWTGRGLLGCNIVQIIDNNS